MTVTTNDLRHIVDSNIAATKVARELNASTANFIYREGELSPSGNVFSSFASAYAAAKASGGVSTIYFDDSITPVVIPAGTYDLKGITLASTFIHSSTAVEVYLGNGVVFTDLHHIRHLFLHNYSTSTPIITLNDAVHDLYLEGSRLNIEANMPWLSLVNSTLILVMTDGASIYNNSSSAVITADAASYITVFASGIGTAINPYTLDGACTSCIVSLDDLASLNNWQTISSYSIAYQAQAAQVAYAGAGGWASNVSGALTTLKNGATNTSNITLTKTVHETFAFPTAVNSNITSIVMSIPGVLSPIAQPIMPTTLSVVNGLAGGWTNLSIRIFGTDINGNNIIDPVDNNPGEVVHLADPSVFASTLNAFAHIDTITNVTPIATPAGLHITVDNGIGLIKVPNEQITTLIRVSYYDRGDSSSGIISGAVLNATYNTITLAEAPYKSYNRIYDVWYQVTAHINSPTTS